MSLHDEIFEQPEAARRLLGVRGAAFDRLTAVLARRRPTFVLIAARGSSDHAVLYAQYLFAIRNALPVGLATPSAFTFYGARPHLAGSLVVGISQSGRSPDIVAVLDEATAQGALTVAMTNDGSSPLARAAQEVVELHAGVEEATAATKTYTTELLAVALLSCALDAPNSDEERDLAGIPTWMEQALTVEREAERSSSRSSRRSSRSPTPQPISHKAPTAITTSSCHSSLSCLVSPAGRRPRAAPVAPRAAWGASPGHLGFARRA
jgi:glucosamine--fructose-6-phosphate aminotransferase (isomerizing)